MSSFSHFVHISVLLREGFFYILKCAREVMFSRVFCFSKGRGSGQNFVPVKVGVRELCASKGGGSGAPS